MQSLIFTNLFVLGVYMQFQEYFFIFNIVVSLHQIIKAKLTSQVGASDSTLDLYMFGTIGEMAMATAPTHAQTTAQLVALSLDISKDSRHIHHSGLLDHIDQACLLLSFGLADATLAIHSHNPMTIPPRRTTAKELVYTLACKML